MNLLSFFKTRPDRPVFSDDPAVIRRSYEARRWSVFLSVLFGYGLFYTSRMNFSVAKKAMLDEGVMSATQMGVVGSALLFVYSVGKFTNGFLADRCNIARFMSTVQVQVSVPTIDTNQPPAPLSPQTTRGSSHAFGLQPSDHALSLTPKLADGERR